MLIMLSGMFGEMGEDNFQFMYTKRLFKWNAVDYSWFKTTKEGLASLGMFVFMPIFHRLHVVDNTIILFAAGFATCSVIVRGLTNELWWIFYLSAVIETPVALFFSTYQGADIPVRQAGRTWEGLRNARQC